MNVGDVMEFEVDQVVTRQDHLGALGYDKGAGSVLKSMPRKPMGAAAAVAAAVKPPIPTAMLVKPPATLAPAVMPAAPAAAPASAATASSSDAATAAPGAGMMDKAMDYAKKNPVIVGGVAVVLAAGAWWFWSKRRASPAPVMGLGEYHHTPKRKRRKSNRKSKK